MVGNWLALRWYQKRVRSRADGGDYYGDIVKSIHVSKRASMVMIGSLFCQDISKVTIVEVLFKSTMDLLQSTKALIRTSKGRKILCLPRVDRNGTKICKGFDLVCRGRKLDLRTR